MLLIWRLAMRNDALKFSRENPERRRNGLLGAALAACLLLLSPAGLKGQALSGLTGSVTDPTGAVLSGTKVTITNEATQVVTHVVTTAAGTYAVSGLQPGTYSVSVNASGFQQYVNTHVNVEIGTTPTVDI